MWLIQNGLKQFVYGVIGLSLWLGMTIPCLAQQKAKTHGGISAIGFITGIGFQNPDQAPSLIPNWLKVPVDYRHQLRFFQAQIYFHLAEKGNWEFQSLIQPQFNLTRYKLFVDDPNFANGYEFGFTSGLLVRRHLFKRRISLYFAASVGPVWTKGIPIRQAELLNFSDSLVLGLTLRLHRQLCLDLRPGFRHTSNAGTRSPNGGINNIVLSGGLYWDFFGE
ncbi:MAG: acyloxyacyl hydrolase [Bacteroidota bacterium]